MRAAATSCRNQWSRSQRRADRPRLTRSTSPRAPMSHVRGDAAADRFGGLDVYINDAGIAPNSLLDDLKVEDWEAVIDVNLKGPFYGIAAALPVFRR